MRGNADAVCDDFLLLQLEKLLQKNYFLHQSAKDGYRSYLQAYASYSLKKIFDVNQLDLAKVGKSFGFASVPAPGGAYVCVFMSIKFERSSQECEGLSEVKCAA